MKQERLDQSDASLLLILPLGVFCWDGKLFIDSQAANGLGQWLSHFGRMTLGLRPFDGRPPSDDYVDIGALGLNDRLDVVLLPDGSRPLRFLRRWPAVRRTLSDLIDRHDYLQFAIGGAWGDWGALGALMAARRGRKAAVWTDRVESEVMRIDAFRVGGLRRVVRWINSRIAYHLERRAIRRSTLGLFHGMDTFNTYRPLSSNPHLVHDIHLKPADRIPPARLAAKIADAGHDMLDIIYIGRLHPDKGVMDWIETLHRVAAEGISFRARWFGAGPQIDEARTRVETLGLVDRISFPGLIVDRSQLLEALRDADLMLFCHLTPESPRCLIEALVSGTPIIGYGSSYSQDLVSAHGGGILTPMEPARLAQVVVGLARDRAQLADLFVRAARDGHDMNDVAVFAHRCELMKAYC